MFGYVNEIVSYLLGTGLFLDIGAALRAGAQPDKWQAAYGDTSEPMDGVPEDFRADGPWEIVGCGPASIARLEEMDTVCVWRRPLKRIPDAARSAT